MVAFSIILPYLSVLIFSYSTVFHSPVIDHCLSLFVVIFLVCHCSLSCHFPLTFVIVCHSPLSIILHCLSLVSVFHSCLSFRHHFQLSVTVIIDHSPLFVIPHQLSFPIVVTVFVGLVTTWYYTSLEKHTCWQNHIQWSSPQVLDISSIGDSVSDGTWLSISLCGSLSTIALHTQLHRLWTAKFDAHL